MERMVGGWDLDDIVLVKQYHTPSSVRRARWLCETQELLVGDIEGTLTIFSEAGLAESVFTGAHDWTTDIEEVENEVFLATLLNGVYRYNRDTHTVQYLEGLPFRCVHDVAISRSQRLIAVVGDGAALGELSDTSFRKIAPLGVPNPSAVVFSPDASVIVIGGGEGEDENARIAVVETRNHAVVKVVDLGTDALCIDKLAYSEDGRFVAAGGYQECFLLDACRYLTVNKVIPMSSWVTALSFSHGSQWLYVGDDRGEIFVYNLISGKSFRLRVDGAILDYAACPEENLYVVSGDFHDLRVPWNSSVSVWVLGVS